MMTTGTKIRAILALLVAAVMAVTVTPFTVFAYDAADENEQETIQIETEPTESEEPIGLEEPTDPEEPTEPEMSAPTVKVTRKGPALFLSWTSVEGADYYEVYRSYQQKSAEKLLAKITGELTFTDKEVASGKRAFYRVRAHRTDGSFTDYSDAASNVIYRVYIETGHGTGYNGKWDPGCRWKKYQEAKLMLPICKSMAKYLRAKGVYVYTDADKGNNTNLKWLLKHLQNYNVSVLVNVHCDYKKAPRGTLPLYRYSEQKKLAKCLNAGVHKNVKIRDRGLKKRTNLATLNKTKGYCVTCLFETGNIKKDNKILRKKYDAYGKGLAMGVCSYLGVKW